MDQIPTWLGIVGGLFVIAAALGATVAVYRTNLVTASMREYERTINRLRGEVSDYERREDVLEHKLELQAVEAAATEARCTVLEDLLTKRKDDDKIRAEIAAVKQVMDENVIGQLTAQTAALTALGEKVALLTKETP